MWADLPSSNETAMFRQWRFVFQSMILKIARPLNSE